jgi:hypothetical protein
VPVALSAQDFACLLQLSSLVVDPSRAALRRRVEVRVLVRLLRCQTNRGGRIQRCSWCDSRARSIRVHGFLRRRLRRWWRAIAVTLKRIVREELGVLAGRLASIVAADAKSYDSCVT